MYMRGSQAPDRCILESSLRRLRSGPPPAALTFTDCRIWDSWYYLRCCGFLSNGSGLLQASRQAYLSGSCAGLGTTNLRCVSPPVRAPSLPKQVCGHPLLPSAPCRRALAYCGASVLVPPLLRLRIMTISWVGLLF